MRRLLAAEVRKLTSTRTAWWYAVTLVAIVLVSTALPLAIPPELSGVLSLADPGLQQGLLSTGSTAGAVILLLGIVGSAGEFRHGTITATLLATPRRSRVVAAKLAVYAAAGTLLGAIATALTFAAVLAVLALRDVPLALGAAHVRVLVVGGLAYAALSGVWGVGFGLALRNQVLALATAVVTLFVVEPVLLFTLPEVGKWLPGTAGQALAGGNATPTGTVTLATLSPTAGGLVYAGYAGLVCLAGLVVTLRRDVT